MGFVVFTRILAVRIRSTLFSLRAQPPWWCRAPSPKRSWPVQRRTAGGAHGDGGFEAAPGSGSNGLEVVRGGAGQHLPALDLRGAIPTDVERYLIIGYL